jgi:hypothetical protein
MHRFLFALSILLISQASMAIPYVCETPELDTNGKVMLRFKINAKRSIIQGEREWDLYVIGVTPSNDFRRVVYGSGLVDEKKISLSFVANNTVVGMVKAKVHNDDNFYGEAVVSEIHKGKSLDVICRKQELKSVGN